MFPSTAKSLYTKIKWQKVNKHLLCAVQHAESGGTEMINNAATQVIG